MDRISIANPIFNGNEKKYLLGCRKRPLYQ